MKLTVIGTSGTFPGPWSACSCYLVESDGFRLLLDLGNGALGSLQQWHSLYEIDAVLVTHLHPDHCLDLVPYAYARRFRPGGPVPRLPIYGPPDTQHRLVRVFDPPPKEELTDVYDFHVVQSGDLRIGPFQVRLAHVPHPVESLAVRLTADGRALCYSADSGASADLVDLARDVDLFVCEASYQHEDDNPPAVHLTGREAGAHATEAGVRHLLLTHLPPWGDEDRATAEARVEYDGPMTIARPGTTIDV
jgi:ribonuclease BN (tRNA processing enzyme)